MDGVEANIQPENTCFAAWPGLLSLICRKAVVSGGSVGGVE
jgi:hypothetical protein